MLQAIRGWIAQVDDAILSAIEVPSLIPGNEELVSRGPEHHRLQKCKEH
jgi:hypothetical protein